MMLSRQIFTILTFCLAIYSHALPRHDHESKDTLTRDIGSTLVRRGATLSTLHVTYKGGACTYKAPSKRTISDVPSLSPKSTFTLDERATKPSDWLSNGGATNVEMGSEAYVDFESAPARIGTDSLCGCSVVVIWNAGKGGGCLLAHIIPDTDENLTAAMQKVQAIYNKYSGTTLKGASAAVISGMQNGKTVDQGQENLLTNFLTKNMGLPGKGDGYEETDPENPANVNDGIVVVDGTGKSVAIYIDNVKSKL
jgi:hypothetical protein